MNQLRVWLGIVVYDGKIYFIGGFDGFYRLRSVEVYDIDRDRWLFISNMLVGRVGCGAFIV